jgi:hypothetical protein
VASEFVSDKVIEKVPEGQKDMGEMLPAVAAEAINEKIRKP